MHVRPTLLPGSLKEGICAFFFAKFFKHAWAPVGRKKHQSFQLYTSLYPDHKFVFVGDNGQGDVLAAEMMMQSHPDTCVACFIHKVQDPDRTLTSLPRAERSIENWAKKRIFFFDTYVGAGVVAVQQGLMDREGLGAVVKEAVAEMLEVHQTNRKGFCPSHVSKLHYDLKIANNELKWQGRMEALQVKLKNLMGQLGITIDAE